METSARVFSLRCANCDGPLQVSGDQERFACGHCGFEQILIRRGGTVELRSGVERFGDGAERMASELALQRLDRDLTEARQRLADVKAAIAQAHASAACSAGWQASWMVEKAASDKVMRAEAPYWVALVVVVVLTFCLAIGVWTWASHRDADTAQLGCAAVPIIAGIGAVALLFVLHLMAQSDGGVSAQSTAEATRAAQKAFDEASAPTDSEARKIREAQDAVDRALAQIAYHRAIVDQRRA